MASCDILRNEFISYENLRQSGECNMILDAGMAMESTGLDEETYWYIVDHYAELYSKFLGNSR